MCLVTDKNFNGGFIYLSAPDGFMRGDNAPSYDYTVSFPSDGKMEWTYNWTGKHSIDGRPHQDKRTAKAIFTKK